MPIIAKLAKVLRNTCRSSTKFHEEYQTIIKKKANKYIKYNSY